MMTRENTTTHQTEGVDSMYGIAEIAAALRVPSATVAHWHRRGKLPDPDERLGDAPVWSARHIEPWIEQHRSRYR